MLMYFEYKTISINAAAIIIIFFNVLVSVAYGKYKCDFISNRCIECDNSVNSCPMDTKLFDSKAECDNDCPATPDCYFCEKDTNVCIASYGLGCQHPPPDKTEISSRLYKNLTQCSQLCSGTGPSTSSSKTVFWQLITSIALLCLVKAII